MPVSFQAIRASYRDPCEDRREEPCVPESAYHDALAVADLPAGQMRCVEIEGEPVLLCHTRDGIHALHNVCTHAYARLDEGRLRGHRLICPLHGASFDARSGAVLGAPASQPLRSYRVRVSGDRIEVEL
jgi:3-phenylpropionate/trans-cinnamate dioxygenase ferredoxin subunit